MSEPSARAIEWLGQQIGELSGIRNATARDPSFKNWRQNTLTVMQRIWPADQGRCERFRRIPFSPADPRSSPDPRFTAGPAERSSPQHAEPPSPQPAEPLPGSRGRKGLGVAAKLRDLLGFAGLSAKALTGPLLEPFNPAPPPPRPTPSAPDL